MSISYESPLRKLEKSRGLFFRFGLMVTLVITFIAFEWRTAIPRHEVDNPDVWEQVETLHVPITWQPENTSIETDRKKLRPDNESLFIKVIPDGSVSSELPADSFIISDIIPVDVKPEVDTAEVEFWLLPEIMPEFPGKEKAMVQFLQNNIRYPERERENGINGLVHMNFIIDEFGNVTEVECLRSPGEGFTEEATRVLKKMPRWKPGMQGGKAVKVKMSIPVSFRLL